MPKHLTLVKKAAWMNAATRVVKVLPWIRYGLK